MAQWFVDSASITNLIVTRSYIGSGSTSFNKSQSVLYINNGLRQGIDNTNFNTTFNSSNHIAGFFNGNSTTSGTHIEGYSNSRDVGASGDYSHIEGKDNYIRASTAHIEGENNYIKSPLAALTLNYQGFHVEGGKNTSNGVGTYSHIEGYDNQIYFSNGSSQHTEGLNNTAISQQTFIHIHIEGTDHNIDGGGYRHNHIEGRGHSYCYANTSHIEGYNNLLLTGGSNGTSIHLEGANNIINNTLTINGIHIMGMYQTHSFFGQYTHWNGLNLTSPTDVNFNIGAQYIIGQYNTTAQNFPNVGDTQYDIYSPFIVGGGLNNTTRANIFEAFTVASSSFLTSLPPTRSIILPWVSKSGDFIDDNAAALGGVPLGGIYRTGNNLKIRLL